MKNKYIEKMARGLDHACMAAMELDNRNLRAEVGPMRAVVAAAKTLEGKLFFMAERTPGGINASVIGGEHLKDLFAALKKVNP